MLLVGLYTLSIITATICIAIWGPRRTGDLQSINKRAAEDKIGKKE